MERNEFKIIGVSSQSYRDRTKAVRHLGVALEYPIKDFNEVIIDFLNDLTGLTIQSKDSEEMTSYLGREWSYVIQEKFTEDGKITFKPVRYHLTPKQIFIKLKYDLRAIHSDIWVNRFFNSLDASQFVVPVLYPNEADAIIERGGIVIRVNNPFYNSPVSREESLMDHYTCTHTIETDDSGVTEPLNKLLWKIKSKSPNAFTIE